MPNVSLRPFIRVLHILGHMKNLFLQITLKGCLYSIIMTFQINLCLFYSKNLFNYAPCFVLHQTPTATNTGMALIPYKLEWLRKRSMRNVLGPSRMPRFHFSGTALLGVRGNNRNNGHTEVILSYAMPKGSWWGGCIKGTV